MALVILHFLKPYGVLDIIMLVWSTLKSQRQVQFMVRPGLSVIAAKLKEIVVKSILLGIESLPILLVFFLLNYVDS